MKSLGNLSPLKKLVFEKNELKETRTQMNQKVTIAVKPEGQNQASIQKVSG